MMLHWNVYGQLYYENQDIRPADNCNGFTVINRGTGIVRVNGVPLSPPAVVGDAGDSITFSGNVGEIYGGRITINFAPGTPTPQAVVIQKFYLSGNE